MTYIKRLIRKFDQPLQQIQKRLAELVAVDFFNEKLKSRGTSLKGCHSLGQIDDAAPPVIGQYNSIHNDVFSIRCLYEKDNCVRLRDGTVVSVKNILDCGYEGLYIVGREDEAIKYLYEKSNNSGHYGMYIVEEGKVLKSWRLIMYGYSMLFFIILLLNKRITA